MGVSATGLANFAACPAAFQFYKARVPTLGNDPAGVGITVHELADAYIRRCVARDRRRDPTAIDEALDEVFPRTPEAYHAEAEDLFGRIVEAYEVPGNARAEGEAAIDWHGNTVAYGGPHALRGRLDVVVPGAEVVDWKTTRVAPAEKSAPPLQAKVYAVLADVPRVRMFYPRVGVWRSWEFPSRGVTRANLFALARDVEDCRDFLARPGSACLRPCDYALRCPALASTLPDDFLERGALSVAVLAREYVKATARAKALRPLVSALAKSGPIDVGGGRLDHYREAKACVPSVHQARAVLVAAGVPPLEVDDAVALSVTAVRKLAKQIEDKDARDAALGAILGEKVSTRFDLRERA